MSNSPPASGPEQSGNRDGANPAPSPQNKGAPERYNRYRQYCHNGARYARQFLKRGRADHWLAIGTWALVIVTWVLVIDARDAIEKSQRAWVAPIGAVQTPGSALKAGQVFHFDVEYTNTGREPALDVDIGVARSDLSSLPDNWDQGDWSSFGGGLNNTCEGRNPIVNGPVIYPMTYPAKYQQGYYVLDQATRDGLIKPTAVLVVKGCFVYTTGAKRHESAYCFYLQPAKNVPSEQWIFKICNEGNHAN